jgi:hypothetical protein
MMAHQSVTTSNTEDNEVEKAIANQGELFIFI